MSEKRLSRCPVCGIARNMNTPSKDVDPLCGPCTKLRAAMQNPVGEWTAKALCLQVDPDLFFPSGYSLSEIAACKRVCSQCEVRLQCLAHALEADEQHGVWGGTTPLERERLKQGKGSAA